MSSHAGDELVDLVPVIGVMTVVCRVDRLVVMVVALFSMSYVGARLSVSPLSSIIASARPPLQDERGVLVK